MTDIAATAARLAAIEHTIADLTDEARTLRQMLVDAVEVGGTIPHTNFKETAQWWDDYCPACAEAERIADRLNDEAEIWGTIAGDAFNDGDPGLDVYGSDTKARTFAEAARIARGLR